MNRNYIDFSVEAVITHPKETITTEELHSQFPEWSKKRVHNQIGALQKMGYLEIKAGAKGGKRRNYKILSREPYSSKFRSIRPKKTEKKEAGTTPPAGAINMEQMGLAIYAYIGKLKAKVQELSGAYSDIQSEMQKDRASFKITLGDMHKRIKELEGERDVLRKRIRTDSGKTFSLGELANFK